MIAPKPAATDNLITADFVERLRRYISRRLRDPNDRDDILQESVARVLSRVSAGDLAGADVEPYAFRIAANLIIDGFRRRSGRVVEVPDGLANEEPTPDRVVAAREELAKMMNVIDDMPELRKSVFILVRVEGYSHKRVSEELGISQKAIEKHMSRALADIVMARRRLGEGKASRRMGGQYDR